MDEIYSSKQAAEYLGISFATLKHHIYNTEKLKADKVIGGRLFFTEETLDTFKKEKRSRGRPKKNEKTNIRS